MLINIVFLFYLRALAEAPSSVKHDLRAETGEKVKNREEAVNEEGDDRKAVESCGEDAPAEGKKKKRSGFRDRKVCILVALEIAVALW